MIFGFCILFIFLGIMSLSMDLFIPITPETAPLIGVSNLFGLMFAVIGIIVLAVRSHQVGISPFLDMPGTNKIILFHHRRGKNPNVSIQRGKLLDLEYIKAKNKIFKDTGSGFRIAGHDCRNTHETIAFDIPNWLADYFHQVRNKTGTRKSDEFIELIYSLRVLEKPITANSYDERKSLEEQLNDIPILEPIMKDHNKRKELLDMGFDKIKRLELICCDGYAHSSEEVEDFIDSATPNELDTLNKQEFLNDRMKDINYKEPGQQFNYGQLINVGIAMMFAAMAVIILMSYFGG